MKNGLSVTHVNIRLSVSLLLAKLLFIEVIAAVLFIIFQYFLFENTGAWVLGKELTLFSLPLYIAAVFVKTFLTFFVILQWLNEYYEITPTLLYHRRGLIFKVEEQYPLENMQRIEISQNILGKLFNYGTISIYDPRRQWYEDMAYIHNPMRYAEILEGLIPSADIKKSQVREHLIEKDKFDPNGKVPQRKQDTATFKTVFSR